VDLSINTIIILLIIGILAGFISGALGVGGGIIIIPALVFILGIAQHQAQGISLGIMLAPIGIIAFLNYHKAGYTNLKYSLIILAAFFIGSYLGSKLAVQIPAVTLKKIFGGLVLIAGIRMIFWP
jgi:uncharacterized membrane protein YfcA